MAIKMTVVYECKECGTEITINSEGVKSVDPIYCCGRPIHKKVKSAVTAENQKATAIRSKKNADSKIPRISKKPVIKRSIK